MLFAILLLSFSEAIIAFLHPINVARAETLLSMKSKAIPFLDSPPKLDGSSVGDFGFDPLGLTELQPNLNYVRAAELKNGRVAMLAVVGFLVQQKIHFFTTETNPLQQFTALGLRPNLLLIGFISMIEILTFEKSYSDEVEPGKFECFSCVIRIN